MSERSRTGVLVVRAWVEPNRELRARITRTPDIEAVGGSETVTAAGSVDEVAAQVRDWLNELIDRASRDRDEELTDG